MAFELRKEQVMASKLSRSDITSADRQQLGYEYQHLYFLKALLQIKENEIIVMIKRGYSENFIETN